jgi:putative peptide zinc metalloprotease protein
MEQTEQKNSPTEANASAEPTASGRDAIVPERPALAPGVQLIGQFDGAGFRERQWLLMRDGQFVQVTELLYRVLERSDGASTLDDIAEHVGSSVERAVSRENVEHLVRTKLVPMGLVAGADGRTAPTRKSTELIRGPLSVNFRVKVAGHRIEPVAHALTFLHTRAAMVPLLAAVALVHGWLYGVHGVTGPLQRVIANPDAVLIVLPVMLAASLFHEFGHASALLYEGGRVRWMGAGFVLVFPALYTDTTDGYRLSRGARIRIDLAGPYFHLLFGLAVAGVYLVTGDTLWLVLILLIDIEVGRQFLPIGRLDGYWALADITGIPDFLSRLVPFVVSLLPLRVPDSMRLPDLTSRAKKVFLAYIAVLLVGFGIFFAYVLTRLPGLAETAWRTFLTQQEIFRLSVGVGDVETAFASGLQLFVLALEAAAAVLFLYLITWRPARKVWAWSRTRPAFFRRTTRGAVLVAGGATLAIIGSLYPWRVYSGLGLSREIGGLEWVAGRSALVGGILGAAAAATMFLSWKLSLRKFAAVVALALGLAGASLATFEIVRAAGGALTEEWMRDTIGQSLGTAPTPSELETVRETVSELGFSVVAGTGPFLIGIAGLLAAFGGGIAITARIPSVDSLREAYADVGEVSVETQPERGRRFRYVAAAGATTILAIGILFIVYGVPSPVSRPEPVRGGETSELTLWPPERDHLRDRLADLGFPVLSEEALTYHTHQHLDVFVRGSRVTVPPQIGIDAEQGFITVLHTHAADGVIHVEAPEERPFTLGQFFRVWGVRLSSKCLGSYCREGDERVRVFVDGRIVRGNPDDIRLRDEQQIVVTFGSRDELPSPVPSSYDWATQRQSGAS